MGLKSFHIVFIVLSVIVTLGFGGWCFLTKDGTATTGSTTMGTLSVLVGVALFVYGLLFLRKMSREKIG